MRDAAPRTACRSEPPPGGRASRAFTVLELLIVISLIAILASITLVIGRSVTERSKIAQAKAEMAVLAAALEQYKQQYGDYPWTPTLPPAGYPGGAVWDGGAAMFNALSGNLGPKAAPLLDGDGNPRKGRTFVDLARFTLDSNDPTDLPEPDAPDLKENWFNDPWGKWYYYEYKKGAADTNWKSKGFLLYSHGPDGGCFLGTTPTSPANTGLLENFPTEPEFVEQNRDNIYHGRD